MNSGDFQIGLGAVIGCIVGAAIAFGLHLLFPDTDMTLVQALIVVVATCIGVYIEHSGPDDPGRNG